MDKHTREILTVALALTLFLSMSLFFISSSMFGTSTDVMNNRRVDAMEKSRGLSPAAQELTTWYHDGSNTTGWTTSYGEWTLNSSGIALFSNVVSSGGIEHASFNFPLSTTFVVDYNFKLEAQVQYTPTGSEEGGLDILTCQDMGVAYRLAYGASGSSKVSWAINHYTGDLYTYDYEYTSNYMNYSSIWYNPADSTTRTNLGDGVVSTSEHAAETRTISVISLHFYVNEYHTYPDIRIDWIKITGGVAPEVDSIDDIEMEYSDSVSLIWTPEAYAPENFELYIDDVLDDYGSWNGSQISFPLTNLDPGYYKYDLIVYDDLDNFASDTVYVNVTDTTVPTISDIADFSIPYGISGEYLTWLCDEPYPEYFVITKDSVVIDQGPWNGTDLRVNLNGLSVASYIFILSANDTYGNYATDEVIITVMLDDNSPSVTPLEDITYELGLTGNHLVWICSDLFPDSYIISKNGTAIDSGLWNGSSFDVIIDGLEVGVHLYTLFVNDTIGNSASDTVLVTVTQPATTPTSTSTGTTSITITTTSSTTGGQLIDSMTLVIAGAAGILVLLIVVIVLMKKK